MDVTNCGAGITMDAANPMISRRGSQYEILGRIKLIIAPEIVFAQQQLRPPGKFDCISARAGSDGRAIIFGLTHIWPDFIVRN
jgi:hypothetical protein